MKTYLRPIGFLSGAAAEAAVAGGMALPLAGGPLAFSLVEHIERDSRGRHSRVVSAVSMTDGLGAHCARRPLLASLSQSPPPLIMGVINATPDSFSDGDGTFGTGRSAARAATLIDAGANLLDIGGESTRPGALPVDPADEADRVLPIIQAIQALAAGRNIRISVDTRNAATIRTALAAGADMINDVSALTHDPDSLGVLGDSDAPVILMHMQGDPGTMQIAPAYEDVALDIYDYLEDRIRACEAAGIARERLIVDPGIGFGKTVEHNLMLLSHLSIFHGLGVPLMVGTSRKGFIARLSAGAGPGGRLPGSLASALGAVAQGVQIVRVHDVAETAQAFRVRAAAL